MVDVETRNDSPASIPAAFVRLAVAAVAVAAVVLWRHRENLRRLLAGQEERLGSGARRDT